MLKRYTKGIYKVVEINNSTALRTGQLVSQVKALKADFENKDVIENGIILGYDITGAELKLVPYVDGDAIFLHYTEELFLLDTIQLNTFALEFDDAGVAYPRGLAIKINDSFTTNNFKDEGSLYVVKEGILTAVGAADTAVGHVFHAVDAYLPDGETKAKEFTYIGNVGGEA